ncbi:MAG: DUF378 domain-containing protein [Clostridia bacterium]|nr:DUF378 domain-containing protein [Clostridia bacterium]
MVIVNLIAFIIAMIGCLNWGLVGIFNWNLVSAIFGAGMNVGSSIIYILVLLSAIWLILSAISNKGRIVLCEKRDNM